MSAVTVVMSGDDAKLRAAHERMLAQQQKLLDKYKEGMSQSKKASETAVSGIDSLRTSVISAAATYATVTGAMALGVRAIGKAWELVKQSQAEAMQGIQSGASANTQLVQVAAAGGGLTAAQDFAQMKIAADRMAFEAGATREMGRRIMFEARSQGFEKDAAEILSYHQVFGDMDTATTIAGKIPKMFPKSGITPIAALNKAMMAAGTSPEDFKRFGNAVATAAAGGGIAGSAPEETMATLAIWASQFKSGDTAADRLKQFSIKAGIDKDLAGLGAMGAFRKLQTGPEAEAEKFLGDSSELREAYSTWEKTIGAVESETKRLQAGGNVLQEKKLITDADLEFAAIRKRNRAEGQLESATVGAFGEAAGTAAAIQANIRTQLLGTGLATRVTGGAIAGTVGTLAGEAGISERTGTEIGVTIAKAITGFFMSGMNPVGGLGAIAESAKKLDSAADKLNAGGVNAARAQAATANP